MSGVWDAIGGEEATADVGGAIAGELAGDCGGVGGDLFSVAGGGANVEQIDHSAEGGGPEPGEAVDRLKSVGGEVSAEAHAIAACTHMMLRDTHATPSNVNGMLSGSNVMLSGAEEKP